MHKKTVSKPKKSQKSGRWPKIGGIFEGVPGRFEKIFFNKSRKSGLPFNCLLVGRFETSIFVLKRSKPISH